MGPLTDEQIDSFHRDGFLIIEEGFLAPTTIETLRERFAAVFDREYCHRHRPRRVDWKQGRDRDDVTRQICNWLAGLPALS